jgi:pyruvate formate lyase activating enzyme
MDCPDAMLTGRIARISRCAVHDGPGIRTAVFFKGCPLRCAWCHSPETQALAPEILLLPDRCLACGTCLAACATGAASLEAGGPVVNRRRCQGCGTCAGVCPAGAREISGVWMTADALMQVIRRDVPFYDGSGGGVTFSGGEPLLQPTLLLAMLERCRAEGISTAVETCGYASRRAILRASVFTSLFLFDLKIVDDTRHRAATGVSNRLVLSNLRALAARRIPTIIRFPLVPGMTDDDENVRGVGELSASLGLTRIDVLPYHRAGIAKYRRLDRPYPLTDVLPAAPDAAEAAAAVLRGCGIDARVGGTT